MLLEFDWAQAVDRRIQADRVENVLDEVRRTSRGLLIGFILFVADSFGHVAFEA